MANPNCVLKVPSKTLNEKVSVVATATSHVFNKAKQVYEMVFGVIVKELNQDKMAEAIEMLESSEPSELKTAIEDAVKMANSVMERSGIEPEKNIDKLLKSRAERLRMEYNVQRSTVSQETKPSVENIERVDGKAIPDQDGDTVTDGDLDKGALNEDVPQSREDKIAALAPSDVIKPIGSISIEEVYTTYMWDDMAKYTGHLIDSFKGYVSKSWLSTEMSLSETSTFNNEVIKDNIRTKAKAVIQDYYEKLSEGIIEFGTRAVNQDAEEENGEILSDSVVESALFVYNDPRKLPPGAELNPDFQIVLYDSTVIDVYDVSNTGIFPQEKAYAMVLPEGKSFEDISEEFAAAQGSVDPEDAILLDPDTSEPAGMIEYSDDREIEKPVDGVRVDRDTMQTYHDNTAMRNVYYAHTILNELDTFVRFHAPMLDATYVTKVRTGNAQIDVTGSDMASKMLKLNIMTTPIVLDNKSTTKAKDRFKTLIDATTSEDERLGILNTLSNKFDSDGTKLVSTYIDGRPATAIILTIGNSEVMFHTYEDATEDEVRENGKWYVRIGGKGGGLSYNWRNISSQLKSKYPQYAWQIYDLKDRLTDLNAVVDDALLTKMKEDESFAYKSSKDSETVLEISNNLNDINTMAESTGLRYTEGKDKYIAEAALELGADYLANMPEDVEEAAIWLAEKITKNKNELFKLQARSLYYRYFAPKPYYITEIDPITGQITRTKHASLYYKGYKTKGNKVAKEALASAMSQFGSTEIENKAQLKNGVYEETRVQDSSDYNKLAAITDTKLGELKGGIFITDKGVVDHFRVRKTKGNVEISYYADLVTKRDDQEEFVLTLKPNPHLPGTYMVVASKPLSNNEIRRMASRVGVHSAFLTDKFIDTLNAHAHKHNFTALDFIGTVAAIKLANVNVKARGYVYDVFDMFKADNDNIVRYPISLNTEKFKTVVSEVLAQVNATNVRTRTKDAAGNDYASSVIRNKGKELHKVIREMKANAESNPNHLYSQNDFVQGVLKFTDNEVSKGGVGLDWDGKSNDKLTELETARYLIDGLSLQKAKKSNWKIIGVQPGAMSDRKRVGVRGVTFDDPDEVFFPIDAEKGGLDTQKLRGQYASNMIRTYNTIANSAVGQWRLYLGDMIRGIGDGLINETQRQMIINADIDKMTNIGALYSLLESLRLPYDEVLKYSGLSEGAVLYKNNKGYASIKPALVQMAEIVNDPDPTNFNFLIDMSLQEMKTYLASIGYTMSPEAKEIMKERFPGYTKTQLEKMLIEGYFYQNGMMEMQSIQIATGDVMAYGNKTPKNILTGSFFEQFLGEVGSIIEQEAAIAAEEGLPYDITAAKLQAINETMLPNGKTFGETDLEELNKMGADYNRIKFMKAIMLSDLNNNAKLKMLMYDDLMTQLSPMYVDRVKRNQVLGTSGYTYVFASKNKPGAYLSKKENIILIKNPGIDVFSMGSGNAGVRAYDGELVIDSSYAYKHNNSLGNKFSNFRARGPIKAVNGSTDENGNTIYEKFAAFPMFNWEIMQFATPEHQALMRRMMNAIQFEDKAINPTTKSLENQFNGLYMLREPLLSESDPNNQIWEDISAEEVLKHGEYLGEVKVTDTDGNTKTTTVAELLYDLRHGIINEDQLRGFTYQTNKVLIPDINNKADIFDYYGGIEGNKKMLNSIKSEAEKKKFMEEFPFGWVEYQVMQVMSNYRGLNGNYPIRNASINKVVFKRTTKTGQQHMNSADVVYGEGVEGITHFPVSNEYAGTVLMPEHDPDTTGEWNIVEEVHNNMLTMMSQVNSASTAQGNTMQHTSALFNALGDISNNQLKKIDAEIKQIEERQRAEGITDVPATKEYIVNLLRDVIKTRKDPGITGDMLAKEISEVSLDLKMLVRLVRSAVNAAVEKSTIKRKAKGGQFVLASVQNRVKYYDYGNATGLLRASVNVDLSRTDDRVDSQGNPVQNAIAKDNSVNGLLRVDIENRTVDEANAVLQDGWHLHQVKNHGQLRRYHTSADYVYVADYDMGTGEYGKLHAVRLSELRQDPNFKEYVKDGRVFSPWMGDQNHVNIPESSEMVKVGVDLTDALYEASKGKPIYRMNKETGELQLIDPDSADFAADAALAAMDGELAMGSKGQEGQELKWVNYEIDGQPLVETDEYMSLKESARLPKVIGAIQGIQDLDTRNVVLEQTLTNIPDGILAKYHYEKEGNYLPIYGKGMTAEAAGIVRDLIRMHDYETINGLVDWIVTYDGMDSAAFTGKFKAQLNRMLEQEIGSVQPAEFYSPPMHQAAMLLEEGDSHQDVVGTANQPNYSKLFSLTYTDPATGRRIKLLSELEEYVLETDWESARGQEIVKKLTDYQAKFEAQGLKDKANTINTFIVARNNQQEHMKRFFSSKINKMESMAITSKTLTDLEYKGLKVRAPYFLLKRILSKTSKPYKVRLKEAKNLLDKLLADDAILSNPEILKDLIEINRHVTKDLNQMTAQDQLGMIKGALAQEHLMNSAADVIDKKVAAFKAKWTATLANNYEKALTFISARIPAQGKQSAVVGKIKNFVYTTRNTIYSPIELLAISGADYDIDKQNNVTWDMASNGKIVDWTEYVKTQTTTESSAIVDKSEIMNLDVTEFTKKLKDEVDELEAMYSSLGYEPEKIEELISSYKVNRTEEMTKAVQNFTLHKLMQVYGSTANAVESSVMVIMNDLGVIKDFMDSFKITDKEIKSLKLKTDENGKIVEMTPELVRLIQTRQNANPFTPSTTMIYEKLNMDGKMGIAIYASALKGYLAAYYAWLQNDSVKIYNQKLNELTKDSFEGLDSIVLREDGSVDVEASVKKAGSSDIVDKLSSEAVFNQSREHEFIKFKTNEEVATALADDPLTKEFAPREGNLAFVYKDPETGLFKVRNDLSTLANTKKHMVKTGAVYGRLASVQAKQAYKRLVNATSVEEEYEILENFMNQFNLADNFDQEPQAWKDLSDLLSAATDNAKELILGKIGSNNTTSSIIATMVAIGFELKYALPIINDPMVQAAVKEYEKGNLMLKDRRPDVKESFKVKLEQALKKYMNNSKYAKSIISDKELEEAIIKDYADRNNGDMISASELAEQFKEQKALRRAYNPALQVRSMVDGANELTQLSAILKINTGMANGEVDVINYMRKVEKALGWIYDDSAKKSVKVTLDMFLKAIAEYKADGSSAMLTAILEAADKKKNIFNIPYIIFKNDHFVAYLNSFQKANTILEKTSSKIRLIKKYFTDNLPFHVYNVKDFDFNQFIDVIDDALIGKYYNEKQDVKVGVPYYNTQYGGTTFDLSKARRDESSPIPGRLEFVKEAAKMVDAIVSKNPELSEMSLLEVVNKGKIDIDHSTGERFQLLSGVNTNDYTVGEIAEFKFQLRRLKFSSNPDHKMLYDILFNYSLITDKAGLNRNSISTLFPAEEYNDFSAFLNESAKNNWLDSYLEGKMRPDDPVMYMFAPVMAPEVSTRTGSYAVNSRVFGELKSNTKVTQNEDNEIAQEDMNEEGAGTDVADEYTIDELFDMAQQGSLTAHEHKTLSNYYDTSVIDQLASEGLHKDRPVVKSGTNSLLYAYSGNYDLFGSDGIGYVPIFKISTVDAGMINANVKDTSRKSDIRDFGYDWGWEISIDDSVKGRLLKYAGGGLYWVLDGHRQLVKMSAKELETANNGLQLEGYAIKYAKSKFNKSEVSVVYVDFKRPSIKYPQYREGTIKLIFDNSERLTKLVSTSSPMYGSAEFVERLENSSNYGAKIKQDTTSINDMMSLDWFKAVKTTALYDIVRSMDESKGLSVDRLYASLYGGAEIKSTIDGVVGSLESVAEDIAENESLRYVFVRMSREERANYLLIKSDLAKDIKLKNIGPVPSASAAPAAAKYLSIKKVAEYKGTLEQDIRFLKDEQLSGKLLIGEYLTFLQKKANVQPKAYMGYYDIDIITLPRLLFTTDKVFKQARKNAEVRHQRNITLIAPLKLRKTKLTKLNPVIMKKLGSFLNKRFKNTTVRTLNTAEIKYIYGSNYANSNAFTYEGVVVINTDKATVNTVFHEMGHLYLAAIKDSDPNLYATMMDKLMEHPDMESIKQTYPELSGYDLAEELFVEMLANYNSGALEAAFQHELANDESNFGRVEDAFAEIFGDFLGTDLDGVVTLDDSLMTLMAKIGKDIIFNKNSALNSLSSDQRRDLKHTIDPFSMTQSQMLQYLQEKGFIRTKCS